MSQLPKRGEYGYWYNEVPITDKHEALDVLRSESPTYEPNHLSWNAQLGLWEIVVPWYSHGDSGGDQSGYDYLQIDQNLAQELAASDLIKPREIKLEHGPYFPHGEFVLSETGRSLIQKHHRAQLEKACGMLIPGTHTDLTGEARRRGDGREHWRYGELYFDFFAPNGICRVYPNKKEILYPFEG